MPVKHMNSSLKSLGAGLLAAGLLTSAQAALTVIDFDETSAQLSSAPPGAVQTNAVPDDIQFGDVITTQYSKFGLTFSGNNKVSRNRLDDPAGVASPGRPQSGPSFLMNGAAGVDFSIDVLTGFSLSSMVLDYAANTAQFTIRLISDSGTTTTARSLVGGTGFRWAQNEDLGNMTNVRRIEFDASPSSVFAIDFLRFDVSSTSTNVPEPAALSLVALALAGVGLSRRRRG